MSDVAELNPAEQASERALAEVRSAIECGESFLLEAGAGAGKTYSLIKTLHFLVKRDQNRLAKRNQKIACITFTNVAKNEIESRTDRSPLIHCDTIHAFCWSLIGGLQKHLRSLLTKLEPWTERLEEVGDLGERRVEYTLGHRSITNDAISIHHDDVLSLTIKLMEYEKFRRIVKEKYPIILIDEYQDTNAAWVESIKNYFLGSQASPLFGFFGDHWQKIYGYGCGKIEHPAIKVIGKEANFRSVLAIVDCLNRMRPELSQFVVDPDEPGEVRIFHTNDWAGQRQTGNHWGGDLPAEAAHTALESVMKRLGEKGWDLSPQMTKILMLTHRVLASEQGYSSLPQVFRYNESFTKKEHPHIAFFVDQLEPAIEAFLSKRYGEMFAAIGSNVPLITRLSDKARWAESMQQLIELREKGTVGDVITHLRTTHLPKVPDAVEHLELKSESFDEGGNEEMPRVLRELQDFHAVAYREIVSLTRYLQGHSPFETKHGVKGAEFENVLVVIGRGWNQYNFNSMLEFAQDEARIPANKLDAFERNRNLFYVACSRPKKRLAILFTQELSESAMQTVRHWFGNDNVEALAF